MDEDGGVVTLAEGEKAPNSAADMLRYSPRQVQMAPGQGMQNPNANQQAQRKVLEKYLPQIEAASIRRTRAETAFAQAQDDQDYVHKRNDLDQRIKQASIGYVKSAKDLSDLKDNYRQFGFRALLGLAIWLRKRLVR